MISPRSHRIALAATVLAAHTLAARAVAAQPATPQPDAAPPADATPTAPPPPTTAPPPPTDAPLAQITDEAERRALTSQLARAEIEIAAIEATELRLMSKLSVGQAPGPESSLLKTVGTELSQRLTEIAVTAAGPYAAPYQPHVTAPGGPSPGFRPPNDGQGVGPESAYTVTAKYLNDRAGSIYAGTNEIQRNIMAKAVLGL